MDILDPFGPHHRHLRIDPVFVDLCDRAKERGMIVGLDVSVQLIGPTGHEYRRLCRVLVGIPEKPALIREPLSTYGSLGDAARRALNVLERM